MLSRTVLALLVAVALGGLVAGCGGSDTKPATTTVAKPAYCTDAEQVKAAIQGFSTISIGADMVPALTAQVDRLRTALTSLQGSASKAFDQDTAAVRAALKKTEADAKALVEGGQLTTALVDLPSDIDAVVSSLKALSTKVQNACK